MREELHMEAARIVSKSAVKTTHMCHKLGLHCQFECIQIHNEDPVYSTSRVLQPTSIHLYIDFWCVQLQ